MKTARRRLAAILVLPALLAALGSPLEAGLCMPGDDHCATMAATDVHAGCASPLAMAPAMSCCERPAAAPSAAAPAATPPRAAVQALPVAELEMPATPERFWIEAPRTARLQQDLGLHALHSVYLN